jgi:hypothetical protein
MEVDRRIGRQKTMSRSITKHAMLVATTAATLLGVCACAKDKPGSAAGASSSSAATQAVAATAPSSGQPGLVKFQYAPGQFALSYPSDWARKTTKDDVLALEKDSAMVTVDYPSVPPHPPGMMTMRSVVNGYADDLKKHLEGFRVVEDSRTTLAGAKAQHVLVTGTERAGSYKGQERKYDAVVAIRNERVYIIEANAPAQSPDAAHGCSQKIIESWNWTK